MENISERARGYGIPGVTVDGMDVLAVYEAAKEAVERARSGKGPTFIECKTYRYYGHFSGEAHILPSPYRSDEEITSYRDRDPIESLKTALMTEGVSEAEFIKVEEDVVKSIDGSVEYMKASAFPKSEQAYEDAYAVEHETMPVKGWS